MVDLPEYDLGFEDGRAWFHAATPSGAEVRLEAARQGESLQLDRWPTDAQVSDDPELWRLRLYGTSTFAVALALRGWPLIRSQAHWAAATESSDIGEPEGLALKIAVFEAEAQERGWVVATPRIPGLPYSRDGGSEF
jgi:hypothetical protein